MESAQSIKSRLKSIKNIGQITKAMELVAAIKMRKSQEIALNSRAYAYTAIDILARISLQETDLPKLLQKRREIKKIALVLLTSDKGLAGSFNNAVIRLFEKYLKENNIDMNNENYSFVAIGKKAISYLENKGISAQGGPASGGKIKEKFVRVGDFTSPEQTNPISNFLSDGYLKKEWDQVILFSTYFKSALKQEVLARKIFPIEMSSIKQTIEEIIPKTGKFADLVSAQGGPALGGKVDEYLIEPSPKLALEALADHLVKMQFYHLILETNASEHAARRMAMQNASDNAKELSESLNLLYNKSRQTNITKEITEIVSSIESLNN